QHAQTSSWASIRARPSASITHFGCRRAKRRSPWAPSCTASDRDACFCPGSRGATAALGTARACIAPLARNATHERSQQSEAKGLRQSRQSSSLGEPALARGEVCLVSHAVECQFTSFECVSNVFQIAVSTEKES